MVDTGGCRVEGTLVDTQRRPVAGADISLTAEKSYQGFMARSGTDGSFTLKGIEPGEYRATASKEGVPRRTPGQKDEPPPGAASPAPGLPQPAQAFPFAPPPVGVRVVAKKGEALDKTSL